MERKRNLLVEIGVEELPHSFIPDAMEQLNSLFTGLLRESRVGFGEVKVYSTPRRMTLLIGSVEEVQASCVVEKRGPSLEKAYLPGGKPSAALLGFLKGNGAKEEQLVVKDTGNAKYLFLELASEGLETESLVPEILRKTLGAISFPKRMKWESSGFTFARPIRWILALFGEKVIPFSIADIQSSRYTFGHRAYAAGRIELGNPSEYEVRLLDASVVADRGRRLASVREQVSAAAEREGLEVPEIAGVLFERSTDLVEFPHAVLCSFESHFLELPPEVLMSEMMEHQHYFPLVEKGSGKLSNRFVAVSNIRDNACTGAGYQRVLRARLNDGKFFYSEDKKRSFLQYAERLRTITFHEKLGMMDAKVERIRRISGELSGLLGLDDGVKSRVDTTASLCKNDLLTLMVGEFPELQGIMGSYYARSSGYPDEVAAGIREHYLPRFAADALPKGIEGAVVGIADRLDTIMGIFSIGLKPKGSKDPFGLRRRVLGIIRIIIGARFGHSVRALIEKSSLLYGTSPGLVEEVSSFFKNRIRSIFEEMGFSYDEIDASMANVLENIYEAYRRVQALHEMRGNENFEHLLVSFKRIGNIIRDETQFSFSEDLLREREEKELYAHFKKVEPEVLSSITRKDYQEVYRVLGGFKSSVDVFFDKVLVMEEDLKLRANRMGLLKTVIGLFADIIDFSKIVRAGE